MIHDNVSVGDIVVINRPDLQSKDIYVILPIDYIDDIKETMRFYKTATVSNRDFELGNWVGNTKFATEDGSITF